MHKYRSLFLELFLFASLLMASQTLYARDVSLENNPILLTQAHGGDGSAWGQSDCAACHVRRNIHRTAPKIRDIVLQTGYASCTGCHGQNGTSAARECAICHNSELLPKNPIMNEIKNHNFNVDKDSALADSECIACHDRSDMDGKFEASVDLTHYVNQQGLDLPYSNQTEFCLRCHNQDKQQPGYEMAPRFLRDPLVMMEKNYRYIDKHGYPKGSGERTYAGLRDSGYQYGTLVECTDCHAMHGSHNEKLIIDRSDTGAFLLNPQVRKQPVFIDVEKGNYAQHCVVCHESEFQVEETDEDTGNGLSGVHQVGGSCLDCHVHGMAVQTGL
ncbi:MAG: hypothetical protein HOE45_03375 [Gammaproteobacteria bacterium]|jgi:hypothetical protein|nr:hypothetical protein [Gammaproteobacteria bacterium]